jgi:hypothetical protein
VHSLKPISTCAHSVDGGGISPSMSLHKPLLNDIECYCVLLIQIIQLSTMDLLVLASMKNAANCDIVM